MIGKTTALVTGANKGLGREVARSLASRGLCVFLGSRDPERGSATEAELRADGLDVTMLALDVTDERSVTAAVTSIAAQAGRLDILVNNAGIHAGRPALEIDADDMRRTYETNVFGIVTVTRCCLPLLKAADAPRIVNVASTTASHSIVADASTVIGGDDTSLAYASSKSAVTMLTLQYANAFRRSAGFEHFRINAITPGYIATDLNNFRGPRTVAQGARIVVEMALLGSDGPSGGFFNEDGPLPW